MTPEYDLDIYSIDGRLIETWVAKSVDRLRARFARAYRPGTAQPRLYRRDPRSGVREEVRG